MVGQLTDMHEAVLVHADIDKRAEGRDIGDNARQLHADFEVFDGVDAFGEAEDFKLLSRVPARLGQFLKDVVQRRKPHGFGNIILQSDLLA